MLCKRCVLVLCRRSSLLPPFGDQQETCWFNLHIIFYPELHLSGDSGSSDWTDRAYEKIQVPMSSFIDRIRPEC